MSARLSEILTDARSLHSATEAAQLSVISSYGDTLLNSNLSIARYAALKPVGLPRARRLALIERRRPSGGT